MNSVYFSLIPSREGISRQEGVEMLLSLLEDKSELGKEDPTETEIVNFFYKQALGFSKLDIPVPAYTKKAEESFLRINRFSPYENLKLFISIYNPENEKNEDASRWRDFFEEKLVASGIDLPAISLAIQTRLSNVEEENFVKKIPSTPEEELLRYYLKVSEDLWEKSPYKRVYKNAGYFNRLSVNTQEFPSIQKENIEKSKSVLENCCRKFDVKMLKEVVKNKMIYESLKFLSSHKPFQTLDMDKATFETDVLSKRHFDENTNTIQALALKIEREENQTMTK